MLNDEQALVEATTERRGFLGWIGAMVAGAAEAVSLVGQKGELPAEAWREEINHARDEYGMREALELGERNDEACRIIREHGLQPARFGRGPQWLVQSSLTPFYYANENGECRSYYWVAKSDNGDLRFWDDPIEALIEAEPLYLADRQQPEGRCDG